MTTKQAAEKLGVNVRTVQRYIQEGKLEYNWIGRKYDISEEAIQDLLARNHDEHEKELEERRKKHAAE